MVPGCTNYLFAVCASQPEILTAAVRTPTSVNIFDAFTGDLLRQIPHKLHGARLSPSGMLLAAHDSEISAPGRSIKVWATHSGALIRDLGLFAEEYFPITFNPKEDVLFVGTLRGEIQSWNLTTGLVKKLPPFSEESRIVYFYALGCEEVGDQVYLCVETRERQSMAEEASSHALLIWELDADTVTEVARGDHWSCSRLVVSRAGGFIASQDGDSVSIVALSALQERPIILRCDQDFLSGLAVSPNGSFLAAGGKRGEIWIWDREAKLIAQLPHSRKILSMVFLPDNERIVAAVDGGEIRIWNLRGCF